MYSKSIPFKDFKDNPRNEVVHFNLTEREFFKLLVEFKTVIEWRESMKGEKRELDAEEVVVFYNAFEEILLTAYGIPSEDGRSFTKTGLRYDFVETACFNACMVMFVTDPSEATKLLDAIMPKGMEEIVKKADANLAEAAKTATDADMRAEIDRLRAQLAEQQATQQ